jgi:hypothetical protein
MRRVLISCATSLLLYFIIFGALVDRPLSLGLLGLEMAQKTAALSSLRSPKLVILAGSNGPYSHSCLVIGDMLNMPCENAGIAVGIGLDAVFANYAPLLHPGDVVYMPMELAQYTETRAQYRAGADAGLLLREDTNLLVQLPADRVLGAIFCCSLADLLEAVVEMPLARSGVIKPQEILAGEYNFQGDRIDNAIAASDLDLLRHPPRAEPAAAAIRDGFGTALIAHFVTRETANHVTIIGGLPTDYLAAPLDSRIINAIASIYLRKGGGFEVLPNHSLYPVQDFFNGEDHLARPCQLMHSEFVAYLLGIYLHRTVHRPPDALIKLAATCPSAMQDYAISAAR